jgi:PAS domain S-box-containing protein
MGSPIDIKTGLNTDNVRDAQEVNESEDFSTLIVNSSTDGILAYDIHGCYTLWNPAMEKLSGKKKEEVLGKRPFDVFPFLKEIGLEQAMCQVFEGKTVKLEVFPYTIPETGRRGFSEETLFPLRDERGKIVGGLAIVRDVTDIKSKLDALKAKNEECEARIRSLEEQCYSGDTPRKVFAHPSTS